MGIMDGGIFGDMMATRTFNAPSNPKSDEFKRRKELLEGDDKPRYKVVGTLSQKPGDEKAAANKWLDRDSFKRWSGSVHQTTEEAAANAEKRKKYLEMTGRRY